MGSHKKAYKNRRKYNHPKPPNSVLAKRKRDRKKRLARMKKIAQRMVNELLKERINALS